MNENSIGNWKTIVDKPANGNSLGRIDQYELIRELGGGGFGTVYLARDTVAGIDVAVKGLPPLVRLNKEELENVRKNFALVSRLHHPNIAAALTLHPVTNAFYNDKDDAEKLRVFNGDTLVVMQYAPGVTLSQWRKQFPDGKVPLDKALEITRQIASALDYAHKEKILHRDIKPANVMIETGADGSLTARVLDFGLAAEIRSSMSRVSQSITDTSGTRPYMAPEQWLGEDQGKETDQYALAVLFNELVTGKVPFVSVFDTGDPVLMMNVVGNRAFNPSTELSKPIRLALSKALAKKREDRFDSCTAFVDAPVGRGVLTAPSGKAFGKIAAVGLLVLGLAGGVWYWQDAKEKEEARIALEQKAELERKQKEEAARKAAEEARRIAEENAKKEKAEAERKQKEEAARIAAEKEKAEAEERARKAEEARIAAENDAERKAELEVFRLSAKAQSAHDLIDGESSEIKEFFASEIRAIENDRRAGDDAKANSKYVIATNFYAQALMAATALKGSVTKYQECKELLPKIERAKERADEVNAAGSLPSGYRAAQEAQSVALAAFKAKRFDECKVKRQEAESLFVSLRTDVINAVLDIAEGHKNNERWEQCKQEADRVLVWDADNAKAIELKNAAEQHMVPSVKFLIKVDGTVLNDGFVYIDKRLVKIPFGKDNLEKGTRLSPFTVDWRAHRKSHVGHFDGVVVDWTGERSFIIEVKADNLDNSKVQLWEGGPYWATKNIGAEKPEDYGYYFWWGDTVGYKREGDKWVASDGSNSNFVFRDSNTPTYKISYLRSEGWITSYGVLSPQHDAAQKHWGGNWRMPTKMELDDLVNKCDWRWTQVNGVNGYVVRGKGEYSSKSIFLPCAGFGNGTSLNYAGSYGHYWSSVPTPDNSYAWGLAFNSGDHSADDYGYRNFGQSVRPVQGFTK